MKGSLRQPRVPDRVARKQELPDVTVDSSDDEPDAVSLEQWVSDSASGLGDRRQEEQLLAIELESTSHDADDLFIARRPREPCFNEHPVSLGELIRTMRQAQRCKEGQEALPARLRFRLAVLRERTGLPLDIRLL